MRNNLIDIRDVITISSKNIVSLIEKNKKNRRNKLEETLILNELEKLNINIPFSTSILPRISIKRFIKRLVDSSKMCYSTLILMNKYIDRYCDINGILISEFNIYKLLLIACIVACKFNEDKLITLQEYSLLSGISLRELIYLEKVFLEGLNFKLYVSKESYFYIETYISDIIEDKLRIEIN
jgi:hypothetical protein